MATFGDHYRDRLSHTLEMAQLARALARNLRLNEDLCEAIALAHDLGHTPFGHAGQETLDTLLSSFGLHFEHNEQSRRIVEVLEDLYPHFRGLNLSHEVLQGLAKHQTHYDQKGRKISGKTLEAQVVDLADEIAYHNHDIDDGLRSKLFTLKDLGRLRLFRSAERRLIKNYGSDIEKKYLRYRVVSELIGIMIDDVIAETDRRIKKYKIKNDEEVIYAKVPLVAFSPAFEKKVAELRRFLWDAMYQSPEVLRPMRKGQKILVFLFKTLHAKPHLLPKKFREKVSRRVDSLPVVVKDYVAGMTDTYATALYDRLRK